MKPSPEKKKLSFSVAAKFSMMFTASSVCFFSVKQVG